MLSTGGKPYRILVIQLQRLGDHVRTLAVLKALREDHPAAVITMLAYERFGAVTRVSPLLDEFISLSPRHARLTAGAGPNSREKLLDKYPALAKPFDLALNFSYGEGQGVLAAVQAGRKVGRTAAPPGQMCILGDWAKYIYAASSCAERHLNSFNFVDVHIGMAGLSHRPVRNYLQVSPETVAGARRLFATYGDSVGEKRVALQLGAYDLHRAWPVRKFAEVVRALRERGDVEIVLLGSTSENKLGEELGRLAACPVTNLIGRTSPGELAAVLRECQLLISNDTAPVHFAAAVGTRVLGLYLPPAHVAETGPYGEGHFVFQGETTDPTMAMDAPPDARSPQDGITLEAVTATANALLDGRLPEESSHSSAGLYRSRFLANGTLLYWPYQAAAFSFKHQFMFINRLIWESALGLEHDAAFTAKFLPAFQQEPGFPDLLAQFRAAGHRLSSRYREAAGLCQAIVAGAAAVSVHPLSPTEQMNTVNRLEAETAADSGPLETLRRFHEFEIADRQSSTLPDLAGELADKYSKLHRLVMSIESELDRIF